jgi:hypothetical protein
MWTHDIRVGLQRHDYLYAFPAYKFLKDPGMLRYDERELAVQLAAADNLLRSFGTGSSAPIRGVLGVELPWDGRRAPGFCTVDETLRGPRGGMPVIVANRRSDLDDLSIQWLSQYREGVALRLSKVA